MIDVFAFRIQDGLIAVLMKVRVLPPLSLFHQSLIPTCISSPAPVGLKVIMML